MYEYKFMPAPKQVRKGQVTQNDGDALTRTLDSEISLIAHGGWEFLRTERMPVTGRWLFLPVRRQQEFMVFRRPTDIRAHVPLLIGPRPGESVDTWREPGVKPRRVRVLNPGHGTHRPQPRSLRPALPLLAS